MATAYIGNAPDLAQTKSRFGAARMAPLQTAVAIVSVRIGFAVWSSQRCRRLLACEQTTNQRSKFDLSH